MHRQNNQSVEIKNVPITWRLPDSLHFPSLERKGKRGGSVIDLHFFSLAKIQYFIPPELFNISYHFFLQTFDFFEVTCCRVVITLLDVLLHLCRRIFPATGWLLEKLHVYPQISKFPGGCPGNLFSGTVKSYHITMWLLFDTFHTRE